MDGIDGLDFINIYSRGETKIGKWMSNFQKINIIIDGKNVSSLEGYWYYLLTGKSYLLRLHGYSAKMHGMKESRIYEEDDAFREKFIKAIDLKIKSNITMFSEFLNYDINIPLVHFYAKDKGKPIKEHDWFISHIDKRRKQFYKKYKNGAT